MPATTLPVMAQPLSVEEYRRLSPGDSWRYQLIAGVIDEMPSAPSRFHQRISGNLFWLIETYLRSHPLGELYAAPFDVELDAFNVFQPDLTFVSNERAAKILVPEGARGAPDLVVEILSPSTGRADRRDKRPVYARCGVAELWLVDPETRQVSLYRLVADAENPARIFRESGMLASEVLPGLSLPLAEVFAERAR